MGRRVTILLPLAALGLLSACSASVSVSTSPSPGTSTSSASATSDVFLPRAKVEQEVSDQLTASVGSRPDSITCPGDLDGALGTTMRCVLASQGEQIGLTVTVTSVEGTNVRFKIKVDDAVMPSAT